MNDTPKLCDTAAVRHAIKTIIPPGQVTEVRALDANTDGRQWTATYSGYFDDPGKLATAIAKLRAAKGIYFIPNAIEPALLARAANRLRKTPKGESTADTDIAARRWLLIDLDAVRPSGISAADAEHEAAIEKARVIRSYLVGQDWPEPIAADSGNGAHLLFRIDLPTDDEELVKRCLEALGPRFDDNQVTVDRTVFNPARIWKLYGTVACKGDSTDDRPHRMAKLLYVPDSLEVVSREQLEALAGEYKHPEPEPRPASYHDNGHGTPFDVDAFIQRHGLAVDGPADWNGRQGRGQRWTFTTSPMCGHNEGAAWLAQHAGGAVSAGCHHASCAWDWKELRERLEPGCYDKQPGGGRKGTPSGTQANATKQPAPEPPPYEPFPVDLLPMAVGQYVSAASAALGCDAAFVALPLLSSLASCVGNTRRIKVKQSWTEPAVIWTVTVGRSGTTKSPAWELGVQPLQQRQDLAFKRYEESCQQYERDKMLYEADHATWKRDGRKRSEPPPEKPEEPVPVRYVCADATIEAVAVLLEENPRGILVARDELSGWLASFDAYKGVRGADVAHWLSMHRAGPVTVDRKTGRRVIHVPRAAVCIAGSIQPEILGAALCGRYDSTSDSEQTTKEHLANGLASRLLFAYPPLRAKQWTDADIPGRMTAGLDEVFTRLLELDFMPTTVKNFAQDDAPSCEPVCVPMSDDARREFIRFYNSHNQESATMPNALAAAWSKLEGYPLRFALLFQLVEDTHATYVERSAVEAGIALARWFGNEAARIYAEIGAGEETEESRKAREQARLVEWIRTKGGEVTPRKLNSSGPRAFRQSAEAAELTLRELADAGHGEMVVPTPKGPGRPKGFVFRLHTVEQVESESKPRKAVETVSFDSDSSDSNSGEPENQWGEV